MTEVVMENMIMLDRKPQGASAFQPAPSNSGAAVSPQPAKPQFTPSRVTAPSQPEEIPTIQIDENQDEVKIEDIPF